MTSPIRQNLISVSANGLEAFEADLETIRSHVDELMAHGVEYEEQDRRAEPVTMTLLITIALTSAVTTTVSELVKKIIGALSDRLRTTGSTDKVLVEINKTRFRLPTDQAKASAEIDVLEKR